VTVRRTPEQVALLSRAMSGPITAVERVMDAVAWLAVAVTWLLPLTNLSRLPDAIPTHFGADGRPDAYGGPGAAFLLAAFATAAWLAVFFTRRIGRLVRLPVPITEENHVKVGTLSRQFLTAIGVVTALMFAGLQVQTIRVALGAASGLSHWFGTATLLVYIGLLVGFIVAVYRHHPKDARRASAER